MGMGMQTTLVKEPLEQIDSDVLVVLGFEQKQDDSHRAVETASATDTGPAVNAAVRAWLHEIQESGEFSGRTNELVVLHKPADHKVKRFAVAGAGKIEEFGSSQMRQLAGVIARALKQKGAKRLVLALPDRFVTPDFVSAAVEGAILGNYEPDQHKTEKKERKSIEVFSIFCGGSDASLDSALERGQILAESQNFARDLVNEPSNLLTPEELAARAAQMAAEYGLDCEVLDEARMRELGMGALLGVSQGSAQPPVMIIVKYTPARPLTTDASHLGLVGKGVTFDSGGLSIKPSDGMEKMKYDMAGAAAALGAMRAIAKLKPAIPVTAIIPSVENMTGSRAQRPGDIVTSLSGRTIEVLNTDAEGRLILADALTYAQRLGCTHLADAATLTGAIVVALGHIHVGVFTNNEELLQKMLAAGRMEGEKMWHMPLDEEYKEYLKSAFADLPNIGGRWGGAITAAMFLKHWADPVPWVHLDIAGTAWLDDAKPYMAKGPSGVAVRSFVQLAMNW
jgi:leucyl aminopeptidase